MPQYKLYYFDIRGLAEPIRLCFSQAGIPFEDIRIKYEEWPQVKAKMPFGRLPLLEADGKQLCESFAILRYIAREHGLEADDKWDRAVGDELVTSWLDMHARSVAAFGEPDKEQRRQKILQMMEDLVKPRLKLTDERLGKSSTGFIAGNKPTWVDFALYNLMDYVRDFLKMPLDNYPHIQKFILKIEELPKIKEWQQSHQGVQFTLFPNPLD